MEEIIITIRTDDRKEDFGVVTDMLVADLVDQLCARGVLTSGALYTVMKGNDELDQNKTFAESGIQSGDILDIGSIGTAG